MTTLTIDDAILSTLEEGYTLPASWYTDRAIAELERERILSRSWQYAGPAELVAEPGSFLALRIAHAPVVLVRDEEGELRGFVNVCRHRAHPVAMKDGCRKLLQCRYHGWTYTLDGRLENAPRMSREMDFDRSDLSTYSNVGGNTSPQTFVSTPFTRTMITNPRRARGTTQLQPSSVATVSRFARSRTT